MFSTLARAYVVCCISNHLDNWDSADFEDRRLVVDGLISQIRATNESVQIEWKI